MLNQNTIPWDLNPKKHFAFIYCIQLSTVERVHFSSHARQPNITETLFPGTHIHSVYLFNFVNDIVHFVPVRASWHHKRRRNQIQINHNESPCHRLIHGYWLRPERTQSGHQYAVRTFPSTACLPPRCDESQYMWTIHLGTYGTHTRTHTHSSNTTIESQFSWVGNIELQYNLIWFCCYRKEWFQSITDNIMPAILCNFLIYIRVNTGDAIKPRRIFYTD